MNLNSKLNAIFKNLKGIEPEQLTDNAKFGEDLGLDSLDNVEIIMECEKEFDIKIPDTDVEPLQTYGQLVKYIEGKVPAEE